MNVDSRESFQWHRRDRFGIREGRDKINMAGGD